MPENARKDSFRVSAGKGKCIGMTYPGGNDAHQRFALARSFDIDFGYLQCLIHSPGNSGTRLDHGFLPDVDESITSMQITGFDHRQTKDDDAFFLQRCKLLRCRLATD
jgi:hypothetical protein